ncbi:hypothetical protein QFC21_006290 [Naganishia friedmannii]|uniref:Uncharacterized protein n=1 Tax=Naganishia friedmannii TaxID=89922 RepID=A0ACC2V3E4_9TREE|nr:hypothetical protein QFC21_006290 [Naganishia friedmannii]
MPAQTDKPPAGGCARHEFLPFPDGYGASVHFQYPGKEFLVLGTLTNERPSAIYRLRPLQPAASSTTATSANGTGTLGIQIQPLAALSTISSTRASVSGGEAMDLPGSAADAAAAGMLVRRPADLGSVDVPKLAEKIVKNLFNYLHSFEGGPTTLTPETPIPLGVFQKWYERFLSKVRNGGVGFLDE